MDGVTVAVNSLSQEHFFINLSCCIIICTAVVCEHPLLNQSVRSSLYILDYSEPAVVGTSISFNCSDQEEVLIGPSTAICMNDGQWVPDPNYTGCEGT